MFPFLIRKFWPVSIATRQEKQQVGIQLNSGVNLENKLGMLEDFMASLYCSIGAGNKTVSLCVRVCARAPGSVQHQRSLLLLGCGNSSADQVLDLFQFCWCAVLEKQLAAPNSHIHTV